MNLSLSIPGQYHLQIEKAQLEDDALYECQAGRSESSHAIISGSAWIDMLSEQNHGVCEQRGGWGLINMFSFFSQINKMMYIIRHSEHSPYSSNMPNLLTTTQHIKSC